MPAFDALAVMLIHPMVFHYRDHLSPFVIYNTKKNNHASQLKQTPVFRVQCVIEKPTLEGLGICIILLTI